MQSKIKFPIGSSEYYFFHCCIILFETIDLFQQCY